MNDTEIRAIITKNPNLTAKELSIKANCTPSHADNLIRSVNGAKKNGHFLEIIGQIFGQELEPKEVILTLCHFYTITDTVTLLNQGQSAIIKYQNLKYYLNGHSKPNLDPKFLQPLRQKLIELNWPNSQNFAKEYLP